MILNASDQDLRISIKFIRIADVSSILTMKGVLSPPIRIKPDMSSEERLRDSVLLKKDGA